MNEPSQANNRPCCKSGCPIIYSIATSIAHEEEALACILNAECAKISRAVQTCQYVDQLIAVNNSVQATIEQIAVLEGILKAKLDSIIPLLEDCI